MPARPSRRAGLLPRSPRKRTCARTCAPSSRRRTRSLATWSSRAGARVERRARGRSLAARELPRPGRPRRHLRARLSRHSNAARRCSAAPSPRTEPQAAQGGGAGRPRAVGRHRPQEHGAPPTLADIERLARRRASARSPRRAGRGRAPAALPDAHRTSSCSPAPAARTATGAIEHTLAAEWIERANARLIHALATARTGRRIDRNRFLRMPGGLNGKNGRYCHLDPRRPHLARLRRARPRRRAARPARRRPARARSASGAARRRRRRAGRAIDDPIDRWTPREYFAALCGITEYDRDGKVPMPAT